MKNKNASIAFCTNLGCAIFEIIVGSFTNSIAIISDAIHDFLDSFLILILYITGKKANQKPDDKYTYGYRRYALLGTLICSFMLFMGGILAIKRAVPRLLNPESIKVDYMIIFAVIGIIINLISLSKMQKDKGHKSISAYLILVEDLVTWCLIYLMGIIIKKTNMYILDAVLSATIATYIFMHAFEYLLKSVKIFMDKAPSNININKLKLSVLDIQKVKKISKVHLWSVDEEINCIVIHICIDKDVNNEEYITIKEQVKDVISKYNIQEVSIDIDYEKEKTVENIVESKEENVEGIIYEEK